MSEGWRESLLEGMKLTQREVEGRYPENRSQQHRGPVSRLPRGSLISLTFSQFVCVVVLSDFPVSSKLDRIGFLSSSKPKNLN